MGKYPIKLDIIPMKAKYHRFIKINEKDKRYFHIYFNDNKKNEIKTTSLNKNDIVIKINIIIDYHVKSFSYLFSYIDSIESINFIIFNRNNITDMSYMFNVCISLKRLNLNNFNTNNVTDMSGMFWLCRTLEELNLKNFNTHNVTNMSGMFYGCSH